jgi:hypothetical protein
VSENWSRASCPRSRPCPFQGFEVALPAVSVIGFGRLGEVETDREPELVSPRERNERLSPIPTAERDSTRASSVSVA